MRNYNEIEYKKIENVTISGDWKDYTGTKCQKDLPL